MARTKQRPPPVPEVLDPLPSGTRAVTREGNDAVAYHIPIGPLNADQHILKTTISLPHRSTWSSGLHFHTSHTEYLCLVKGSIFVELDGEVKILSAAAGGEVSPSTGELLKKGLVVVVNRYVRHNWGRANEYWQNRRLSQRIIKPDDADETVLVEEWTDPSDIAKPLFFWNLNGVITAPLGTRLPHFQALTRLILGSWWISFQLFVIFWDLDNWPVFITLGLRSPPGSIVSRLERMTEYTATLLLLFSAKALGQLLGVSSVVQSRTPDDLWEAYKRNGRKPALTT